MSACQPGITRVEGRYSFYETRNLSEVERPVTGQKGLEFFCLFLLGGTESEMSKNLGRMGYRQSSGAFVLKKKLRSDNTSLGGPKMYGFGLSHRSIIMLSPSFMGETI